MHVERREDVLLQILVEALARDNLDHAAEHVVAEPVGPAFPGLVGERHLGQPGNLVGNRLQASLIDTGSSIASIQAPVVRGHAAVGEAGRMRKEIPDRDRPLGGHGGDVFARVILGKAQDSHVLQLGQVLFHRVIQTELALLDQLMTATQVIGLVIEAMAKIVSSAMGDLLAMSR